MGFRSQQYHYRPSLLSRYSDVYTSDNHRAFGMHFQNNIVSKIFTYIFHLLYIGAVGTKIYTRPVDNVSSDSVMFSLFVSVNVFTGSSSFKLNWSLNNFHKVPRPPVSFHCTTILKRI